MASGGGVGVGGAKVAATVTAAIAAARFKKGGAGGGGGGDLTAGDRTGGDSGSDRRTLGPTPPPPGAPRSGAPRPPAGSLVASSSSVVSSVAEGIGALKVEDDVDFQERVRDELRRNRERLKGPLGAPAGGERGVHPAGANKEFLGKYGLEHKRDLFAP